MIIIYPLLTILLFYLIGIGTIKLLKLNRSSIVMENVLIPIVIGFIIVMSLLETLDMIIPASVSTVLIVILAIVFSVWSFEDIKCLFHSNGRKGYYIIISMLVVELILTLPQLLHNEVFLAIGDNNDFAYYISSIEWLTDHTFFEKITYTHGYPLFSLADYIMRMTRIGTDLTGAFVGNLFSLQSYQAFSILIPISGAVLFASIYSVIKYFTKNDFCGCLFGIYAALCSNFIALIGGQYIPQILGVSCLLLSFAAMHELMFENPRTANITAALFVSGTLATYCEFTVYLALAFIAFFLISVIKKKISIKSVLSAIIISVLINVFGFYKAVHFNLGLLNSLKSGGTKTVDAYGGMMLSNSHKVGVLFGFSGKGYLYFGGILYYVAAITCLLLFIIAIVLNIRKKHFNAASFVTITLSIVILLEVFFLHENAAYEEYKHLTSSSYLIITNFGIFTASVLNDANKKKFNKLTLSFATVLLLIVIDYKPYQWYLNPMTSLDSDTMELKEVSTIVPDNQEISIDKSLSYADYMNAVYVLQDHPVHLGQETSSYFQYFQIYSNYKTEYTVYPRSQEFQVLGDNKEIIWSNEKYILVKDATASVYQRLCLTKERQTSSSNVIVNHDTDSVLIEGSNDTYVIAGTPISQTGTYSIKVDYALNGEKNNAKFEIEENKEVIATDTVTEGSSTVELSNVDLNENQIVEFKIYVPKDTSISIESISYMKIQG